jgi:hypothetical protein
MKSTNIYFNELIKYNYIKSLDKCIFKRIYIYIISELNFIK